MKSLILMFCLSAMTLLTLNCRVTAQTVTEPNEITQVTQTVETDYADPALSLSFWDRLKTGFNDKIIYVVFGLIGGVLSKRGFIDKIKYWMGWYVEVSHELGELLLSSSNGVDVINKALQRNGKLAPNSLEDIKTAGKTVTMEFKDFKAVLTPKK